MSTKITEGVVEAVHQEILAWRKDFSKYTDGMRLQSYCPGCEDRRADAFRAEELLHEARKHYRDLRDKYEAQTKTLGKFIGIELDLKQENLALRRQLATSHLGTACRAEIREREGRRFRCEKASLHVGRHEITIDTRAEHPPDRVELIDFNSLHSIWLGSGGGRYATLNWVLVEDV